SSGGWQNSSMIDEFLALAKLCFEKFGDKVQLWTTFSEPEKISSLFPSLMPNSDYVFSVYRNLLLAHAYTYKMFTDDFKSASNELGIDLGPLWAMPENPRDPAHATQANRATEYSFGLFADPIFRDGDFSDAVKAEAGGGLTGFTDYEKNFIKGSADFFGLSYYGTKSVNRTVDVKQLASLSMTDYPSRTGSNPASLRRMLGYLKDRYNNVPVLITGNGVWDASGEMTDQFRSDFILKHVDEVLKAARLDGCRVLGYTYRSLTDGVEREFGLDKKFGLVQVNYSDPSRPRTVRESGKTFLTIAQNKGILKEAPTPPTPQPSIKQQAFSTTHNNGFAGRIAKTTSFIWEVTATASTIDRSDEATTVSSSAMNTTGVSTIGVPPATTLFPPITPHDDGTPNPPQPSSNIRTRAVAEERSGEEPCRCAATSASVSAILIFCVCIVMSLLI
ncbi:lactase-phlorizin hydrolase, partial [Plakobranchus ocellatus]